MIEPIIIHIYLHDERTDEVIRLLRSTEGKLDALAGQNRKIIMLDKDVLQSIADEKTAVDSVITAINSGAIGAGLSAEDKATIIADLNGNRDALNAVLPASVPAPTPAAVGAAVAAGTP